MKLTADERRWHEDRQRNDWKLPAPAAWPFRLPIIRQVRWWWNGQRLSAHIEFWAMTGVGIGLPNGYDLWVLYAIRRGWC